MKGESPVDLNLMLFGIHENLHSKQRVILPDGEGGGQKLVYCLY